VRSNALNSPEFAERASILQSTDSINGKRRDKFIPESRKIGDIEISQERENRLIEIL
jgi:hypothetical protein